MLMAWPLTLALAKRSAGLELFLELAFASLFCEGFG
jgi:hypothetical protein